MCHFISLSIEAKHEQRKYALNALTPHSKSKYTKIAAEINSSPCGENLPHVLSINNFPSQSADELRVLIYPSYIISL